MARSTRQQTVGRISQVADHGDGDEDEDEDKYEDEIPNYAVLLTALHWSRELVSPVCGIFHDCSKFQSDR